MENLQVELALKDDEKRQELHRLLSDMLIQLSDQMFKDRTMYIDGYRFINCSFVNCTFMILRGTFEFHHCLMDGVTRQWGEDAMKCIQLYTWAHPQWRAMKEFGPREQPDGTFSIGKGVTIP
jgi:hypothetical protein